MTTTELRTEFIDRFHETVKKSRQNHYDEIIFDHFTLDLLPKVPGIRNLRNRFIRWIKRLRSGEKIQTVTSQLQKLAMVYEILDDDVSRDLYLKLAVFRHVGPRQYRLPNYRNDYRELVLELSGLIDYRHSRALPSSKTVIGLANLEPLGYDIRLLTNPMGIYLDFVLRQYECPGNIASISALEGDCVIDAGGFIGDTALYFASQVGTAGQVHVFEFIPTNLQILKDNLDLNPQLSSRIEVVHSPLSNSPDVPVYYIDRGPASQLLFRKPKKYDGVCHTETIDNYRRKLSGLAVDFIKMDIEGAELMALEGSVETLSECRPKIAIAIYHSLKDMMEIPLYVKKLLPNYRLHLGHFTIHKGETILFGASK